MEAAAGNDSWDSTAVVARKPRRTGWSKTIRQYRIKVSGLILPTLRYTLVPGFLAYSLYFTEPKATLLDLLNPFF